MNPFQTEIFTGNDVTFENILTADDNWRQFLLSGHAHQLRPVIISEVEKMLKCRRMENGFATFICLHCGQTRQIAFSCKSKICSRCGKKHTDVWSQQLSEKLLNSSHRHIILTVSDKLWPYFYNDSKLQKLMLDTASDLIYKLFTDHNPLKKKIMPGVIFILHPFGDDLESKFHVHALATEGGLLKNKKHNSYSKNSPALSCKWVNIDSFIDYREIRKRWQYEILTALRKAYPKNRNLNAIIDWCYKQRKNGFVIHAKRTLKNVKRNLLKYLARYVRHPAISNRRILDYNGQYVTFSYKRDGKTYQKKLHKFEFIKKVVQHIPDRQFKVVRRCGLYSRRADVKYQAACELLSPRPKDQQLPFNWRKNVTDHIGADPLACPDCDNEMVLFKITYPDGDTFKTVGGYDWLFKRGVLIDAKNLEFNQVKDHEKPPGPERRQLYLW